MTTVNNKIEIYPQNTKSIYCVVSGLSMIGYTPYLTVKKRASDTEVILSKTGTVTDSSTLVFNFTPVDTSIEYGDYVYSIEVENDPSIYTVTIDRFIVVDGVRY